MSRYNNYKTNSSPIYGYSKRQRSISRDRQRDRLRQRSRSPPAYQKNRFQSQNQEKERRLPLFSQKQQYLPRSSVYNNQTVSTRQPSDIKNHIKFHNIKIRSQDYQKFTAILSQMLSQGIGPVQSIQKQVIPSSPTKSSYENINILLGFKYDLDAYDYLNDQKIFQISYDGQKIDFIPSPTPVFQSIIPLLKQKKDIQISFRVSTRRQPNRDIVARGKPDKQIDRSLSQRQKYDSVGSGSNINMRSQRDREIQKERQREKQKQRENKPKQMDKRRSYSKSSNSSSSSQSSYDRNSKKKDKKNKKRKHSRSNSSSSSSRSSPGLVSVLIWGIPSFITLRQVLEDLKQIEGGPYDPQHMKWQYAQDSTAIFLKVKFPPKKAEKLIKIGRKGISFNSYPAVVTPYPQNHDFKSLLKQFQIVVHFPQKVHAYHVYKQISYMSKIVQMVAEDKLDEQSKAKSFLLTLSNCDQAKQLKKLMRVSNIILSQPFEGQLVFRPLKVNILPPV